MAHSNIKKFIRNLFIIFLGILLGLFISFYFGLRMSVPKTDGEQVITGLNLPVEITYDSMGVAQIWAENDQDAYFALGYQHAADRLFQIEFVRRLAKGELSEMFGRETLELDVYQRKMKHYKNAIRYKESLCPYTAELIQMYCNGINNYVKNARSLPFEFYFLPVDFEEFTIEDCMAVFNFQTWYSNALMSNDSTYLAFLDKVGEEKIKSLLFQYPEWAPTTVDNDQMSSINYNSKLPFVTKPSLYKMTESSNAWVISGDRTKSGKPILASDPHLILNRLPQFWYAVGVHSNESGMDLFGITVPGIPFVVMGHNINSAWAFTAGGNDLNDFITVQDTDSLIFEQITDTIYISGEEDPYYSSYRTSQIGVEFSYDESTSKSTIFRWSGFDNQLDNMMINGFRLHKVGSFEQFQKIVTEMGSTDANMVYADVNNNIGYQLSTRIPNRNIDYSNLQTDLENTWNSYLTLENSPHIKNPTKGWIGSANNKPDNNPIVNGNYFANRILSIEHLLNSKDLFEIKDMKNYQLDIKDRYLLRFTPEIADLLDSLGINDKADLIRNWDGICFTSSYETALIICYLDELKAEIFDDELEDLARSIPGKYIENLETLDQAGWFDNINTEKIESRIEISKKAMTSALELADGKTWGDIQTFTMKHPLSLIPGINGVLGLTKDIGSKSGTSGTLNASFTTQKSPGKYSIIVGPSSRFIIDLAYPDSVQMVLPFGNSGNPMSDHFDDFYELWSEGKYWTVPISYNKVKEKAKNSLTLKPLEN